MNLGDDDFTLFGIAKNQAQSAADLSQRWRDLQRRTHPDQHAADAAVAQRLAAQWSARVNQAYQRLKDPVARAAYLCELRGQPIEAHSNTAMPADFLMQQMEWREALAEAQNTQILDDLAQVSSIFLDSLLQKIEHSLDGIEPDVKAHQLVRQALFVQKFQHDLRQARDRLDP